MMQVEEQCLVTDLDNSISLFGGNLHSSIKNEIPRKFAGDTVCVVNLSQVIELYYQWTELFPKIRPYYAYKCNYDPELLKLLVALGCGVDCASMKELEDCINFGVHAKDVVFASPQKFPEHIRYAKTNGVDLTVIDSQEELLKIESIYPEMRLLIRIRCPDKTAKVPFAKKFGCSVLQAQNLLEIAKKYQMKVVGVCFHVGTFAQSPEAYARALEKSHTVFEYAKKIGLSLSILDIGGGFTSTISTSLVAIINDKLESLFSDVPYLKVIAEPGRYFARSPFNMVMKVIGTGVYTEDESDDIEPGREIDREIYKTYYLADGAFGAFFYRMEPVDTPFILVNTDSRPSHKSVLYGPVMADIDMITELTLPELKLGEWLHFTNCGAYSLNLHSEFNGFPKPPKYYKLEKKDRSQFLKLRSV